MIALVAHVRRVDAAPAGERRGDARDLVGRRRRGRRIEEPARHADRTLLEAFVEQGAHALDLLVARRPIERVAITDSRSVSDRSGTRR
ncbi:MAG: hypothetical protein R2939_00075 [Kofleriaceae bacterium]